MGRGSPRKPQPGYRSQQKEQKEEEPEEEQRKEQENQRSNCLFCLQGTEEGPLIQPCGCRGGMYLHYICMGRWMRQRDSDVPCGVCRQMYADPRIRRGPANLRRFIIECVGGFIVVMLIVLLFAATVPNISIRDFFSNIFAFGWMPPVLFVLLYLLGNLLSYQQYSRDNQVVTLLDFNGHDHAPGALFTLGQEPAKDQV